MKRSTTTFVMGLLLISSICIGQTIELDSCGLDTNAILNKFEIAYMDNILLPDSVHDFKKGFDFKDKRIGFFTCDQVKSADGFITKDTFFEILKESGHRRPRGSFVLTEKQKQDSGHLEAIIMIDCKMCNDKDLINKLKQRRKENNLLPGQ